MKSNSRLGQKLPSPSGVRSPALMKVAHSHRNSQVDLTTLSKLIQKQKQELPQPLPAPTRQPKSPSGSQSLTPSQMHQLLQKAKEISQQFKNNHFYSNAPTSHHSRQDSGQLSPPVSKQQSFLNYTTLKELMSTKPKVSCTALSPNVGKHSFNFLYVIGIGGFGKVWKVEHKKTKQIYAMKEMSKALVITKKSVNSVMNEKQILGQLKHPFLINMTYAFQDQENLYLVMDYMSGGDLRYHIGKMRRFSEEQTKFFVACIVVGLEYLHANNIIQRDIKPENLVLDEKGYVKITDMGIARAMRADNASDTSGTPGYMAPEVMFRQPHSFPVDFYALGVIAYEFMLGRRPYLGRSRQEIRDAILAKQVQIKKSDVPNGWSLEAADFINRLIQRKPQQRLGYTGVHELKLHPWFKGFPWSKLLNGETKAPYVPNNHEDNFDQKQIVIEDEENAELINQNILILRDPNVQELFTGYEHLGNTQNSSTTDQSSTNSAKHIRTFSSQNRVI